MTGGGLAANLARVLPAGVHAVVDRGTWRPAPVFGLVARLGLVPPADLERTLNLGVGMVAVVDAGRAPRWSGTSPTRPACLAAGCRRRGGRPAGRRRRGPRREGRARRCRGDRRPAPRLTACRRLLTARKAGPRRSARSCPALPCSALPYRLRRRGTSASAPAGPGGPVGVLVVLVAVRRRGTVDLGVGVLPARGELPLEGVVVGVWAEVLQLPATLVCLAFCRPRPMASTPSYVDPGQARAAGPRISVIRLSWKQRYNVGALRGIPAPQAAPAGRIATGPHPAGGPRWIRDSPPISRIRRSASRSAASAGVVPSADAACSTARVVS